MRSSFIQLVKKILISIGALVLIGFILLIIIPAPEPVIVEDVPAEKTITQPDLIECYVNGTMVMATRSDCKKLSLPPTPVPVKVETKTKIVPQIQQPIYQAPIIKYNTSPNRVYDRECQVFTDGSLHCF